MRSLLVDIYPPTLAEAGLAAALADLTTAASLRGLIAESDVDGFDVERSMQVTRLLYRTGREAIRNVVSHAHAKLGFTPVTAARRADEGHLGLRGLRDLIADAGGQMTIDSSPGQGTRMHLELPIEG